MTTSLKIGKYKHYKGKLYEVLGIVYHSETEEEMVLYKTLYSTEKHPEGTLWVRPKKMFEEPVVSDGKTVKRFEFVQS